MQVPLFWIKFCPKDPAIIFQYIFFKNLIMDVRQTLVSVYILRNSALRPHRLYDHLFINTIVFRRRCEDLRVILLFLRPF